MILLDTHVWLWWLLGDGALHKWERNALDRLALMQELAVSWVSIWETEMLEKKGRIALHPDFGTWIRQAVNGSFCSVLPVDVEVVVTQRRLPESFHSDPADRLIVATAILAECPLATHDQRIRKSGIVSIWEDL